MSSEFENSLHSVEKEVSDSEKMSTSWIKQNMLGSPPKRKLTEAELRVQRAIQKLDIPEWYLNKQSKAPKILKNHTPFDCRQPSWKRGVKPEIISTSSLLENTSDPTGIYKTNRKLKSSMDESSLSGAYGTPRMFENSITEEFETSEPTEHYESAKTAPNQSETCVKSSRANFSLNKSGTFPRASPSRKVQNINMVLPPTPNYLLPNLPNLKPPPKPLETSLDIDENSNFMSNVSIFNNTIEISNDNILSGDDKFHTSKRGTRLTPTSCFKMNLANAISPKPFSKTVGTPFTTPLSEFKIRAHSTSDGTGQTLFTSVLDKPTPSTKTPLRGKTEQGLKFSSNSISYNNDLDWKQSTYWLGEVKPFGPKSPESCCQECGAKAPRIFAAVTTSPNNSKKIFNEERLSQNFLKIVEASGTRSSTASSSSDDEQRGGLAASPLARFINAKQESKELANIIKTKKMQHGNNLAQEIVQEFKDKCALKSKNSYSSPGTKYFVNRLVNDLGGNITAVSGIPEVREVEPKCSNPDSGSKVSTDEELNSARFSNSISDSFKDLDSGNKCALPVTSTLKSNFGKSRFSKKPIITEPFEDDGVFWIPVTLVNHVRTSSLISVMSKRSGSHDLSPSISPISTLSDINQVDERIYENFYELSGSKQKDITKSLKIEKGRILDSGYSDRSVKSVGSDSSLSDEFWSEDFDSSPSESEDSFSIQTVGERVE